MMGERTGAQEALFYGFSFEGHVPPDHMLRPIDRFVDLGDIRERLKSFYSDTGRPPHQVLTGLRQLTTTKLLAPGSDVCGERQGFAPKFALDALPSLLSPCHKFPRLALSTTTRMIGRQLRRVPDNHCFPAERQAAPYWRAECLERAPSSTVRCFACLMNLNIVRMSVF